MANRNQPATRASTNSWSEALTLAMGLTVEGRELRLVQRSKQTGDDSRIAGQVRGGKHLQQGGMHDHRIKQEAKKECTQKIAIKRISRID